MLVIRIIGTVIVGLSCFTAFIKNCAIFKHCETDKEIVLKTYGWTIYGWLWRAFIIVALWII